MATSQDGYRYERVEGIGYGYSLVEICNYNWLEENIPDDVFVDFEPDYRRWADCESHGADIVVFGPMYPNDSYEVYFRVEDSEYQQPQFLRDIQYALCNDPVLNDGLYYDAMHEQTMHLVNIVYNDILPDLTEEAQDALNWSEDSDNVDRYLLRIIEEHCEIDEYEGHMHLHGYNLLARSYIIRDFENYLVPNRDRYAA